jgi:hypothetical protein
MEFNNSWMTPDQWVAWSKEYLSIRTPNNKMTGAEISETMHFIGYCSMDTMLIDQGTTRIGRIGIDNMLFMTLMVFPTYYDRFRLTQRN